MFTAEQRAQLAQGAQRWGIVLEADVLDRFARFADLLAEGNRQMNLTRIAPEDIVALHFLDSLALASLFTPAAGARLLDVGAGAGFPGLPLALAFPELQVTLLDSTRKRLAFLDRVLVELGLTNAQTLHGRAEEIGRDSRYHEQYDLVTARAVAKMETLVPWLLPLVRPGGMAVVYKSRSADEEIAAAASGLAALGSVLERVADVTLPDTGIVRKLALLRKQRSLPLSSSRPAHRNARQR